MFAFWYDVIYTGTVNWHIDGLFDKRWWAVLPGHLRELQLWQTWWAWLFEQLEIKNTAHSLSNWPLIWQLTWVPADDLDLTFEFMKLLVGCDWVLTSQVDQHQSTHQPPCHNCAPNLCLQRDRLFNRLCKKHAFLKLRSAKAISNQRNFVTLII